MIEKLVQSGDRFEKENLISALQYLKLSVKFTFCLTKNMIKKIDELRSILKGSYPGCKRGAN